MNLLKGFWADIKAFEAKVASWLPGLKTKIVTALGAIGSLAALGQDYITQLTGMSNNVVSGAQLSMLAFVCFTLAFWLRGIGDRVNARAVVSTQPTS